MSKRFFSYSDDTKWCDVLNDTFMKVILFTKFLFPKKNKVFSTFKFIFLFGEYSLLDGKIKKNK